MRPPRNMRRYEPLCGSPIKRHPKTKQPVIWASPSHFEHFLGYTAAESRDLLERIMEPGTSADVIYEHNWQVGDVVVWDNRRTIHSTTEANGTSALLYQVFLRCRSPMLPAGGSGGAGMGPLRAGL